MADQLSLFPSTDLPAEEKTDQHGDISALDEMFAASLKYRNCRAYKDMLTFIARFPHYSAFNGCLMYLQNPGATYVATAGAWSRRFGRQPRSDAHPLMILAPMAPVLFLFDIADTAGADMDASLLKPSALGGRLLKDVYEKTMENCTLHNIAIGSGEPSDPRIGQAVTLTYNTRKLYRAFEPDPGASYLIVLDENQPLGTRYETLVHGLGHIFSGHLGIDKKAWWQDRRGVDPIAADVEAESIAFLVLHRKGLFDGSRKYLSGYEETDRELSAISLNAVFHATQYIEDMGKAVWQFPKKKSRYLVT
jgi:hypothetical protein